MIGVVSSRIQDCIRLFLLGASWLLVEPLLSKELVESKGWERRVVWLLGPPEVMGGLKQQVVKGWPAEDRAYGNQGPG